MLTSLTVKVLFSANALCHLSQTKKEDGMRWNVLLPNYRIIYWNVLLLVPYFKVDPWALEFCFLEPADFNGITVLR